MCHLVMLANDITVGAEEAAAAQVALVTRESGQILDTGQPILRYPNLLLTNSEVDGCQTVLDYLFLWPLNTMFLSEVSIIVVAGVAGFVGKAYEDSIVF